jgi:hypothetical protein
MSKWKVSIDYWEKEYEADDEGDALMQAEGDFSVACEARAEEVFPEESDDAAR